ncbi:hypothetical protein KKG46_04420 [Patescibacteria group bacterium]|nr:hypothetical protein [Patescibacteria group bacterium]
MKQSYIKSFLGIGVLSLVLFGAGCNPFQKAEEKAQEKTAEALAEKMLESMGGGNVDVDIDGDSANVKLKGEDGEEMMFGEEVKLPNDLPDAIRVYPGATPKAVFKGMGGPGAVTITLQTNDSVADVAEWYDNEYEGDFEQNQVISVNGSEMRTYDSGDEQIVISIGTDDEDGTYITLNYAMIKE